MTPMKNDNNLFSYIAETAWRHWKAISLAAIILVAAAPLALHDLRFETSAARSVSSDDPVIRFYRDNMDRFGDNGPHVIRLTKKSASLHTYNQLTDALATRLANLTCITRIARGPLDLLEGDSAAIIARASLLNSSPDVLERFADKFKPENIRRELLRTRKRLISADDPALRQLLADDPLDIRSLLLPFIQSRINGPGLVASIRYFDSPDGESRLLFAYPTKSSENADFSGALVKQIDAEFESLKDSIPGAHEIEIDYSGKYALSTETVQTLRREMAIATVLASLALLLLLSAVFRGFRAVIICFVPMALSLLTVLIFARIFFNPINISAAGFSVVIMGLSIDITIHLTARFYQYLATSPSRHHAMRMTLTDCGPPISIGIATTTAAFLCLTLANFLGLIQFALLTAAGLAISLCVSLLAFPVTVRLFAPKCAPRAAIKHRAVTEHIFCFSSRYPRTAIAVSLVITVLALLLAREFCFEMDLRKGIPTNSRVVKTAEEISDAWGVSFTFCTVLTLEADTLDKAMQAQQLIDTKLATWVADNRITRFDSPSTFLLYPEQINRQREKIRAIADRVASSRTIFEQQLSNLGFEEDPQYAIYYDMLEAAVVLPRGTGVNAGPDTHKNPIASKMVAFTDNKVFLQTCAWPKGDIRDFTSVNRVSRRSLNVALPPDVTLHVSGTYQLYDHINELVRADFLRVSSISIVVVGIFVLLFFRRIRPALLTLLPLLAAVPLTLAILVLGKISFAPTGIGMIAMIVGIGIDDAVHVLARTLRSEENDMTETMREIGPILFLTTFSTMTGFGVLTLSHFHTISSMGFAIAIGVFACLLFTTLLVPAVYRLAQRRRTGSSTVATSIILLLSMALTATAAPAETNELDKILDSITQRHKRSSGFSCRFTQVKKIRQLTNEVELTGHLIFKKPDKIRLELRGDENVNLISDGHQLWMEDLDLAETNVYAVDSTNMSKAVTRLLPPVVARNSAKIKELFLIELSRTEKGLRRLDMTPRNAGASPYGHIVMDMDRWGRIRWLKATMSEDEWSETKFSPWRRLRKPSETLFQPIVGDDGKKEPNDEEPAQTVGEQ